MSEDLNLPASLERLEINPERVDCCKNETNRFSLVTAAVATSEPECTLQTLSLKADCPKGNCQCNKKREREVMVKRMPFKRPILRRSKLNSVLLRSPVLKLKDTVSLPLEDNSRLQPSSSGAGDSVNEAVPEVNTPRSVTASCAIQARTSPDDTTINELASYFDLFVHIPKKMSLMAEMMYT